MPRIKISKVAKDLNVALPTVVEFLRSKDISVDDNPNARIEEDVVAIIESHFKSDKDIKDKSQKLSTDRARDREKAKPAQRQPEEITLVSEINKSRPIPKWLRKSPAPRSLSPHRLHLFSPSRKRPHPHLQNRLPNSPSPLRLRWQRSLQLRKQPLRWQKNLQLLHL